MSRCGSCRSGLCTCLLNGDGSTTEVIGLGTSYQPYHARPLTPAFRYMGYGIRTTSQSITLNTDTAISFQLTEDPNTGGEMLDYINFPTRLTAHVAGLYMMGGMVSQSNAGSGQFWQVWIAKNGVVNTPLVKRSVSSTNGGFPVFCDVMTLVRLSINEYVELYVRSNKTSGTQTNAGPATPGVNWDANPIFWAQWMGA